MKRKLILGLFIILLFGFNFSGHSPNDVDVITDEQIDKRDSIPFADIEITEVTEQVVNFTGGNIDWEYEDILKSNDLTNLTYNENATLRYPIQSQVINFTASNNTAGYGYAFQEWSNYDYLDAGRYSILVTFTKYNDTSVSDYYNSTVYFRVELMIENYSAHIPQNTVSIVVMFDNKGNPMNWGDNNTWEVVETSTYCQNNTLTYEIRPQKIWLYDSFWSRVKTYTGFPTENQYGFDNISAIHCGVIVDWQDGSPTDSAILHYKIDYEIKQEYWTTDNWTAPVQDQDIYTVPDGWELTNVKADSSHIEFLIDGQHINYNYNWTPSVPRQWISFPNGSNIDVNTMSQYLYTEGDFFHKAWEFKHEGATTRHQLIDYTGLYIIPDIPDFQFDKIVLQGDIYIPNYQQWWWISVDVVFAFSINGSEPVLWTIQDVLKSGSFGFGGYDREWAACSDIFTLCFFRDFYVDRRDQGADGWSHFSVNVTEWLDFRRNKFPDTTFEIEEIWGLSISLQPQSTEFRRYHMPLDPQFIEWRDFPIYIKDFWLGAKMPVRFPLSQDVISPPPTFTNMVTNSSINGENFLPLDVGYGLDFDTSLVGGEILTMRRGDISFYNSTAGEYIENLGELLGTGYSSLYNTATRQSFVEATCPLHLETTLTKRMTFNPLNVYADEFSISAPSTGSYEIGDIVIQNVNENPDYLIITEDDVTHISYDFTYNPSTKTLTIPSGNFIASELSVEGSAETITIQLFREDNQISVDVVDASGQPIPDIFVLVEHSELAYLGLKWADLTDETGSVEFFSIPNGQFKISAIKAGVETSKTVNVFGVRSVTMEIDIFQLEWWEIGLIVGGTAAVSIVATWLILRSRGQIKAKKGATIISKKRKSEEWL